MSIRPDSDVAAIPTASIAAAANRGTMVSPFAPVKIEPVAKQAATKTLRREDIPNIAVSGMDSTFVAGWSLLCRKTTLQPWKYVPTTITSLARFSER